MKVKTRMKLYGNGVLMHQRRRYFLFFYWWDDWYPLNNQLHEKDSTIVKHIDKLKRLLQDRDDIEKDLKNKIKSLSGRHVSEEFHVKTNEFWFRKHDCLTPVDGAWRGFLNGKLFSKGTPGVQQTVRERTNAPSHPNNRGSSAYTLEDYKRYNGVIEENGNFVSVMTHKDPQESKKGNNSNNNKGGNDKNRRKGESDEDYRARLDSMS